MLEGGEGLADPIDRDGPVFAILCTAPDGALATIYGAQYVNYPGKKYPLVELGFTCGYLNPDMFLEASTRLKEFNSALPLSSGSQLLEVYGASAAPALYCPKDVTEQARVLSASWYDIHSLPDLDIEQIKPTVAARVKRGPREVICCSRGKRAPCPTRRRLGFPLGDRACENALRLAVLWTIYASFAGRFVLPTAA